MIPHAQEGPCVAFEYMHVVLSEYSRDCVIFSSLSRLFLLVVHILTPYSSQTVAQWTLMQWQ